MNELSEKFLLYCIITNMGFAGHKTTDEDYKYLKKYLYDPEALANAVKTLIDNKKSADDNTEVKSSIHKQNHL